MSISSLFTVIGTSVILSIIARKTWRNWCLLFASLLAIYWLQPASPIRYLDFWLPTACIALTTICWLFTLPKDTHGTYSDLKSGGMILLVIVGIGLTRYLGPICCLTATVPPAIQQIIAAILIIAAIVFISARGVNSHSAWLLGLIILIIGVFIALKFDPLTKLVSLSLRSINSQSTELASVLDIRWLGFSYVAFRLMHTLRDRMKGRLPDLTLMEYVIYIIFFPAFSAGPIDRVQRFTRDLRQPFQSSIENFLSGGKRIFIGIFNKFVLADGLAIIALNANNSSQVNSTGWLWIMLYAFGLRIYFDFSGYTDIAIGMGQLVGIQLPENFEHPYIKQNLTLFWNSWHITLAQWFRAYFFNPLTRSLRSGPRNIPLPLIVLLGQLSTFVLIGLWHGITWNFAIWGAWHGIGLFIHNRWTELLRLKTYKSDQQTSLIGISRVFGTLLTFNYVSLGWVWFVLVTPAQSWNTLLKLFGIV